MRSAALSAQVSAVLWLLVGLLLGAIALTAPIADAQTVAKISTDDYEVDDVDAEFDVVITLTTGDEPVGASQYFLRYDPALIRPVLVDPAGGGIANSPECVGDGPAIAICGPINPTDQLQLSTFRITGAWASTPDGSPQSFVIMTIPFEAQGRGGVSPLEIEVTRMLGPDNSPIAFAATSGSATIGGPIPTPTPVPPTATPVPPTPTPPAGADPTATPTPAPTSTPTPTATTPAGADPTATPTTPAAADPTATPTAPVEADATAAPTSAPAGDVPTVTATPIPTTPAEAESTATPPAAPAAADPTATPAAPPAGVDPTATASNADAGSLSGPALPYPGPFTSVPSIPAAPSAESQSNNEAADSAAGSSSTGSPLALTGASTPVLAALSLVLLAMGGQMLVLARREDRAFR